MKMSVIKYKICNIFSDWNLLLLLRLMYLSLPEVPVQERKKHGDRMSCIMCH